MTDLTFHKLSWKDLQKDSIELAAKLETIHIDKIIAISRGGLVIARMLSDLLHVEISHITITSYKDFDHTDPMIHETPSDNFKNQIILIVDEISDSGKTFQRACSYFENLPIKKILTLSPYIKSQTKFIPNYWNKKIDSWIIFPYEIRETTEAFLKLFKTPELTEKKLEEVGFKKWEIKRYIKSI